MSHDSSNPTLGRITAALIVLGWCSLSLRAQPVFPAQAHDGIPVLTLGIFHFNFPNLQARTFDGTDSVQAQRCESYDFHNPDSLKRTAFRPTLKADGIRNELLLINDRERVMESLGDYLLGIFKDEITERDFPGVDFETGRWFNRNLWIFRNIQRIPASPGDRILLIL